MGGGYWTDKDRFLAVFKINLAVFAVELLAGWYSGSLSMVSDGFHASLHVIASLVALASEYKFLGFPSEKIKLWSAGINIILFFPLAALISYEAHGRLSNPPVLNLTPMFFFVALSGLVANVYTVWILKPDHHKTGSKNKNRFYLFIHMIVDTIGSIMVVVGGIEIYRTGAYALDPKLSFALAGLIIIGALWMSWEFTFGQNHN